MFRSFEELVRTQEPTSQKMSSNGQPIASYVTLPSWTKFSAKFFLTARVRTRRFHNDVGSVSIYGVEWMCFLPHVLLIFP